MKLYGGAVDECISVVIDVIKEAGAALVDTRHRVQYILGLSNFAADLAFWFVDKRILVMPSALATRAMTSSSANAYFSMRRTA